ncbi:hepatic lectin-like [Varanus komodoensis]|uniref:hepatic lectin-like n=1 Tax=Varanus komodoensis TaxID=61221 RepID=UPI001CF7A2E6|nr:hepatic lectin-like [Varanus komodoensis]
MGGPGGPSRRTRARQTRSESEGRLAPRKNPEEKVRPQPRPSSPGLPDSPLLAWVSPCAGRQLPVAMAPKGKPAPAGNAPARARNKIVCTPKWIILTTIGFLCVIVFCVTLSMYIKIASKKKNPLEEPMKKLRKTISEGLRNKPFNYASQSLFKKGARTSGAWKVFERSLYYISTEKKTWHDAESFCMSRDAHLASVNTDKEQNYISSQLDEPAWIGLTDENEEGNWKWSDGSRVFPEFWARGSPRRTAAYDYGDMDNDCTFIQPFSLSERNWKDFNCEALYRWVCKESLSIDTP